MERRPIVFEKTLCDGDSGQTLSEFLREMADLAEEFEKREDGTITEVGVEVPEPLIEKGPSGHIYFRVTPDWMIERGF